MLAELDRVTRDTTFNETVLDGSFADRRFKLAHKENLHHYQFPNEIRRFRCIKLSLIQLTQQAKMII